MHPLFPLLAALALLPAPALARRPPRFHPPPPPMEEAPPLVPPTATPPTGPGSSSAPSPPQGSGEPLRDTVRGQIRARVLERLTREPRLDPATAARVAAIYDAYAAREAPIRTQVRRCRRGLLAITRRDAPVGDAAINSLVDGMLGGRAQLHAIDAERSQAVRQVLPPRQFAQLTLMLPLIKAEIHRELLRVVRGRSRAGGEAPPPSPVAPEDDEDLE